MFAVLIFISFIISLFGLIGKNEERKAKALKAAEEAAEAEAKKTETMTAEEMPADDLTDDLELVAVISAAIAASEGTSTDGFVVRSIKREEKTVSGNRRMFT